MGATAVFGIKTVYVQVKRLLHGITTVPDMLDRSSWLQLESYHVTTDYMA